jgi:hypothetical protein
MSEIIASWINGQRQWTVRCPLQRDNVWYRTSIAIRIVHIVKEVTVRLALSDREKVG